MVTSDDGVHDIEGYEGTKLKAYKDTGGIWTIATGHTGPEVCEGLTCTPTQATRWLREDLKEAEDAVNRMVKVPLTQGQFDALVSFTFNLGETQVSGSTLLRKLNAGDYDGAANEFRRWVYDDGKIQPGLVKRRYGEKARFEHQ